MRTEQEMMDAVLGFARRDERIRVVGHGGIPHQYPCAPG